MRTTSSRDVSQSHHACPALLRARSASAAPAALRRCPASASPGLRYHAPAAGHRQQQRLPGASHRPLFSTSGRHPQAPIYDHEDTLHARMRRLKISCETTDMEEEQEQVRGLPAGPAASGLRPPPSRRCAGAVCRHCRWCVFQVYPADAAPVLLSAAGAINCYNIFVGPFASDSPGRDCPPHPPRAIVAAPPRRAPPSLLRRGARQAS